MKRALAFLTTLIMLVTMSAMPVKAGNNLSLTISKSDEKYNISKNLYGLFIEDINYACDGGLVSNLVNNDSFEYEFNKTTAWKTNGAMISLDVESCPEPLNRNNPTYATLTVHEGGGSITNTGFVEMFDYKTWDRNEKKASTPDMGFKKGEKYVFSCYLKNIDFNGTISVCLDSKHNKNNILVLDTDTLGSEWQKFSATLDSIATEDGGLTIFFNGNGTICLDFVTLVPQSSHGYNTTSWKYTTLRTDIYDTLKEMNPSFIRFPGGCLAEGDSLEHLYDWKETIGPLEERVQFYNLWRDDYGRDYINTQAMGYHEYFQLCADLGAKPLPILNVGLTCQGRTPYDDSKVALLKSQMTDDEWQTYMTEVRNMPEDNLDWRNGFTEWIESLNINSQKDYDNYINSIALKPNTPEFKAYVQDILDLIEYANGDANTTYWGALRAANGSPEPFGLEYIGLGNENWGDLYERNFRAIYKEVKKAYPDIKVISSSSPWLDGEAFENNWKWINKDFRDTIVDEHYYTMDERLFEINDRYDNYDRSGAHVFVGEYAATSAGTGTMQTKSNMYEAVEEASYLTGIERNGDIVDMISYAPTLAKNNAQSWTINLLWFDSQTIAPSPSYYSQVLFANNIGDKYIKSTFENGKTDDNRVYESVTVDEKNEVLYVKLINASGKKTSVDLNLDGYESGKAFIQSISSNYKSACNEVGKTIAIYPTASEQAITDGKTTVELGKYDITVVRIPYGKNTGEKLYTLPDFSRIKTTKYYPPAIRIGVPCGIAGGIVIIAVLSGIIVLIKKIIKKKKAKGNEE